MSLDALITMSATWAIIAFFTAFCLWRLEHYRR